MEDSVEKLKTETVDNFSQYVRGQLHIQSKMLGNRPPSIQEQFDFLYQHPTHHIHRDQHTMNLIRSLHSPSNKMYVTENGVASVAADGV